jgi:hypothetical protein
MAEREQAFDGVDVGHEAEQAEQIGDYRSQHNGRHS